MEKNMENISKPDLRDIFDEAVKDIRGTEEWKEGYFRGAKEVVELIASYNKKEDDARWTEENFRGLSLATE
jgi:hypothetical protein